MKGLKQEVALECGNSSAILLNQIVEWFKCSFTKKGVSVSTENKIYRSSKQLCEDVVVLSKSTIDRCKKTLVDKGYITLSFVEGFYRVTHFSLTEKTLYLFQKELGIVVEQPKTQSVQVVDSILLEEPPMSLYEQDVMFSPDEEQDVEYTDDTDFVFDMNKAEHSFNNDNFTVEQDVKQNTKKSAFIPRHEFIAKKIAEGTLVSKQTPYQPTKSMQKEFDSYGKPRHNVVKPPIDLLSLVGRKTNSNGMRYES